MTQIDAKTPQCDRDATTCAACSSGSLEKKFSKLVLGKYQADYCQCRHCGTLQICRVNWLGEAYGGPDVDLDTGSAQRAMLVNLVIRSLRVAGVVGRGARVIDFGAGSGLIVRLMRDQGLDAWGYDLFTAMPLCMNYRLKELPVGSNLAELITAFEVFEHLTDPGATLKQLQSNLDPGGAMLISTSLYDSRRHDAYWDYLSPEHGQHINFFSSVGLQAMAAGVGMNVVFLPWGFHLLVPKDRPVGAMRRWFIIAMLVRNVIIARLIGLCNFRYPAADKAQLAKSVGKK